jgi:hypothetical protein
MAHGISLGLAGQEKVNQGGQSQRKTPKMRELPASPDVSHLTSRQSHSLFDAQICRPSVNDIRA